MLSIITFNEWRYQLLQVKRFRQVVLGGKQA